MDKYVDNVSIYLKMSKLKFILKEIVLKRFLIIAIICIVGSNYLGYNGVKLNNIIFVSIIKFFVIMLIAFITGNIEWKLLNILELKEIEEKLYRYKYILNFGILNFSIPMIIMNFRFPINYSFSYFLITILMWIFFGGLIGVINWKGFKKKLIAQNYL